MDALAIRADHLGTTAGTAAEAVARANERLRAIVTRFEARASALEANLASPGVAEELLAEAQRSPWSTSFGPSSTVTPPRCPARRYPAPPRPRRRRGLSIRQCPRWDRDSAVPAQLAVGRGRAAGFGAGRLPCVLAAGGHGAAGRCRGCPTAARRRRRTRWRPAPFGTHSPSSGCPTAHIPASWNTADDSEPRSCGSCHGGCRCP
jgi:hypothetical protein